MNDDAPKSKRELVDDELAEQEKLFGEGSDGDADSSEPLDIDETFEATYGNQKKLDESLNMAEEIDDDENSRNTPPSGSDALKDE